VKYRVESLDPREQNGTRRRFTEPSNSNRAFQRSWIVLHKWLISCQGKVPIRIIYLDTGLWNPKIHFRQCFWVSNVVRVTYNDVDSIDFWTLLLFLSIPSFERQLPCIIPDIFPCSIVTTVRFPSCMDDNSQGFWTLLMYLGIRVNKLIIQLLVSAQGTVPD